jgi:hypothetical protein
MREYAKHGRNLADASKEHTTNVTKDKNLKRATRELRTLLERFANNSSLDIVLDAVDAIIDDARRDEALSAWFSTVDAYIRKVLLEPGYVIEPDCNNQANHLRENGRQFYDVKYKGHFDNLFNSIGTWFKAFGDDPVCFSHNHHRFLLIYSVIFTAQQAVRRRLGWPNERLAL